MDYSTPGFSVLHYLPEFAQTHVHWVTDAIQSSHSVVPFASCPQSFPASGSFPMSQLFTSGSQSTGASASVLPMSIQGWFPLGLTGLIFLQPKGLSRVFASTTIHQSINSYIQWFSNCTMFRNHLRILLKKAYSWAIQIFTLAKLSKSLPRKLHICKYSRWFWCMCFMEHKTGCKSQL